MQTLTEIANDIGMDKGTSSGEKHNYTAVYEKYFDPIKSNPIKLLEIGIWDNRFKGASPKLWHRYFTNLDFVGFEIQSVSKVLETELGCRVFIGDQFIADDLNKCVDEMGGDYDIIIDDGVHKFDAIRTSFEILYPTVKKGGYYIIEDIHANDARQIEGWLKENGFEYASYCHTTRWSTGDKLIVLTK